MKRTGRVVLIIAAFAIAVFPLLSQTPQSTTPKPAFDVVSIRPSAPNLGMRGGGPRGNRYSMSGANLRMLLQQAYARPSTGGPLGQLQVIGGPNWIDSDRYDIQATVDCNGGVPTREQVQLMIQSMLEDRFQLKAHMETRELPIYDMVVAKDGLKMKPAADQTPPPFPPGGPLPCGPVPDPIALPPLPPPPPPGAPGGPMDPNFVLPRGAMLMMLGPSGMTIRGAGQPLSSLINALQQRVGRPITDKTGMKQLFDFTLTFSMEGLAGPGLFPGGPPPPGIGPGGAAAPPTVAADPVPSLFTALQDLGLRLESTKGPVEVLVIESVQKPSEN